MTPQLYHFTCDKGARLIGRYNCLIIPQGAHPVCGWSLAWFTTETAPDREATGLTSALVTCDRMAFRYTITDPSPCVPWTGSRWQEETPAAFRRVMEKHGDAEHWWVSDRPVRAALDRAYQLAAT